MRKELLSTAKHTVVYGVGNLLIKVVGFLLLPLYTTKLTVSQYGQLSILELTSQIFVVILSLKLNTALLRWASRVSEDQLKKIVFNIIVVMAAILGFTLLITFYLRYYLSIWFFDTADFSSFFIYLIIWIFLETINTIPLALLRHYEKSHLFMGLIVVRFTTVMICNVLLVGVKGLGIVGILISNIAGHALLLLLTFSFLRRKINPKFDSKLVKELLAYSAPLVMSSLSIMALLASDKFLIKAFLSYADVAIYNVAYKFSSLINSFILQSFLLGYAPIAYRMFKQKKSLKFYAVVMQGFWLVLLSAFTLISLYSRELITFLARKPEYLGAVNIIPIICLAFVFKGAYSLMGITLQNHNKTGIHARIIFVGVIINIIANLLMIPSLGLWGAALSTMVSASAILLMFYVKSQKFSYIRYQYRSMTITFFAALLAVSAGLSTSFDNVTTSLLFKTLMLIVFCVIVCIIQWRQILSIVSLLKKRGK